MIPKFLLIMSLGLTPIQKADEEPTEPTTEEVVEETETQTEENETPAEEKEEFDIQEYLAKWFEPSQIAMIMSWVAYAGTILGLVVKVKQLAKQKQTTAEQVKELVLDEIKKSINEEVADKVKPYLDGVVKINANTNDLMKVFTKVLALSQVNDAQSRLAILELIASLGVLDKELIEEATKQVEEQVETEEENKNEALEQIDEIIEDTSSEEDGTSI